jgi:hypothetical protein
MEEKPFVVRVQIVEAQLRGAFISMSCDIEHALTDIACVCMIKYPEDRKLVNDLLSEHMGFAKKINIAEAALRNYNLEHHKTYQSCFEKFRELNNSRNKFAHSRISGDENKQDINILYFEYVKNGKSIKDTEDKYELLGKLNDYRQYVIKLLELGTIIYQERSLQ